MPDTRQVDLAGLDTYVLLSLDDKGLFSATLDGAADVRVHRRIAPGQPDLALSPGRMVARYGDIERQFIGYYWVRGVGSIMIDDAGPRDIA